MVTATIQPQFHIKSTCRFSASRSQSRRRLPMWMVFFTVLLFVSVTSVLNMAARLALYNIITDTEMYGLSQFLLYDPIQYCISDQLQH